MNVFAFSLSTLASGDVELNFCSFAITKQFELRLCLPKFIFLAAFLQFSQAAVSPW
jgi:hypothetical protein